MCVVRVCRVGVRHVRLVRVCMCVGVQGVCGFCVGQVTGWWHWRLPCVDHIEDAFGHFVLPFSIGRNVDEAHLTASAAWPLVADHRGLHLC